MMLWAILVTNPGFTTGALGHGQDGNLDIVQILDEAVAPLSL